MKLIILVLLFGTFVAKPAMSATVHVELFCDSTQKSCTFIRNQVLVPLIDAYPTQLVLRYHNTAQKTAQNYFAKIESAYNDRFNTQPAVFIGERFISGRTNIKQKLPRKVKKYLADNGTVWADTSYIPKITSSKAGAAHILLFYAPDCGYCKEVKTKLLPRLQAQYGQQLIIHYIDVETPKGNALLRNLEKKHHDPGNYIPAVFAAEKFFSGKTEVTQRLDWWIQTIIAHGGCTLPEEAK